MKARVLGINWHDQEPVYSLDFRDGRVLATAGGDKEVRVSNIKLLQPSACSSSEKLAKRMCVQLWQVEEPSRSYFGDSLEK